MNKKKLQKACEEIIRLEAVVCRYVKTYVISQVHVRKIVSS